MDLSVDIDGRAVPEPAAGDIPLVAISVRGSRQPQDSASLHPASISKMNHLTSVPAFLLNAWGFSLQVPSQRPAALGHHLFITLWFWHPQITTSLWSGFFCCCFVMVLRKGLTVLSLTGLRLTMFKAGIKGATTPCSLPSAFNPGKR